jgi:hypothetical protein
MQVKILVWMLPLASSLALAGEPPTDTATAPTSTSVPAQAASSNSSSANGAANRVAPLATGPLESTSIEPMSASSRAESTPEAKPVTESATLHPPPGYREVKKGSTTIYCKHDTAIGSRVPEQTCYTAEQIRELEKQGEAARQMLQQSVRAGALNVPLPPTDSTK